MRLQQAFRLVRPVTRAINWTPIAPAGALGLLPVWLIARDPHTGVEEVIVALRAAAILLALADAFVLDDAATRVSASAPTPQLLPWTVRLAIAALPTTVVWAGAVWIATHKPLPGSPPLPVSLLTVELATIVMVTVGLAAAVIRRSNSTSGGLAAAVAILGLTVMTWLIPEGYRPWVYPGQANWVPAHRWWSLTLIASLATFVWAGLHTRRGRWKPQASRQGRNESSVA